jgi:hypothetical protein
MMFELLDYKAHLIWKVITTIPFFVFRLFGYFAVPFISYWVAFSFFDDLWLRLLIVVIAQILNELIYGLVWRVFYWTVENVFKLVIDIRPSGGRSEDEAWLVL